MKYVMVDRPASRHSRSNCYGVLQIINRNSISSESTDRKLGRGPIPVSSHLANSPRERFCRCLTHPRLWNTTGIQGDRTNKDVTANIDWPTKNKIDFNEVWDILLIKRRWKAALGLDPGPRQGEPICRHEGRNL